ncbi:hypothetical protein A2955_01310 [Candidatus Woesebacteria bacterium RIFCSPLOWO2_01_FULL_37_19]|uniref:Uncharacterized protein n=2 Tax=Candidatus Woeseibacteriota TaxID=1752722 RepID=A0A1F8B228_9BACT|nr:MAG: hypothetical protein A2771_03500 [Candidatus Woesebacteria bacterium RIFCSPHIGHO2_01_FULL_38_26b]OGM58064.1 MAG: hypothetical protein A2955_01310 [Candidatus Woesebacteria bacterium RIFCSPLOWO2_01_FULL_37_19]
MKKPKAPRLVTVAITTTVTIIFWIFFGLYGILTTEPKVDIDPKLLVPLNPTLDITALDSIKGRIFFDEDDITVSLPLTATTIEPTPTPEEPENSEETSPEITLTPTPEVSITPEGG